MKSKSVLLLALLFTACIAISSLASNATQSVVPATHPQAAFAPPTTMTGIGDSINLADSVNGWQSRNLASSNTLSTCQSSYRNATFTQNPPSGFNVAWQNLTVTKLTAIPDLRAVQYASSSAAYLQIRRTALGPFSMAAMRFKPVDAVNLTSVWIYYSSTDTAQLQVISSGTNNGTTPQGGVVTTRTLPLNSTAGWHEVKFNSPVTLTKGYYYWLVLDARAFSGFNNVQWYYVADPGGVQDQQCAAAYYSFSSSWQNEASLHVSYSYPYLNFMLVLRVLPVVDGNPTKVMTYSSPGRINMRELNSGTLMSKNTTRIPQGTHKFTLGTNTSVTFSENWTARFEKYQYNVVQTSYIAQPGLTLWDALFSSAAKPSNPYAWYNRTLRVSSIPADWQINPVNNVTNSNGINFTASYSVGLTYLYVLQTDNVNATFSIWDAEWVIAAASPFSIAASAPSQVISGQKYEITLVAPLANTRCNLTVFDPADSIVFSRSVQLPTSPPLKFPIRFNQTGDFVITLFGQCDNAPEVSYLVLPAITSVPALTSMELQTSTITASLGDIVTISFRYKNTTLGSDLEFPDLPDVVVASLGDSIPIGEVQSSGGGLYSFNLETRRLNSSGGYILSISVSYGGSYSNQQTLTLQLNPPGISPVMILLAGGGSGGAVLAIVAALKYRASRRAKEAEKVKILKQTASLAQLVVVHLGSGGSAYSRNLGTEESVDPNLISGFLTANQSIMSQVFKGKAPSGLRFADYGEYKVVSHVGKYVMSSLFCTEAAGAELQSVLESFTDEFEKRYQKELSAWDGNVELFRGADVIVDDVFSLRLISPYILVLERLAKVKLSGMEKAVVENARRLSAARGIFFMPRIIDYLLTMKKAKRGKVVDIIDSLVKKGVFKQLTVEEASQIISLTESDSKSTDDAIGDLLNGSG